MLNINYYTYRDNGDKVKKSIHNLTWILHGESVAKEEIGMQYTDEKLMSVGDQVIVYDVMGNPINYRGKTLVWTQGRRLKNIDGLVFEYDEQGRRTKKGNIIFLNDHTGRVLKSSDGLQYYYDSTGPIGLLYNGNRYAFRKDLFGNIIAILDSNANVVVNYAYDAWGNHKVLDASGNAITATAHIGHRNPFRYRGYFYDRETGLYYLKSRYYDPQTGRFINMDSVEYADPSILNGLNLYAYCNNNPVMNIDPNGNFFLACLLIGLVVGAAVGFGVSVYQDYKDDGEVFNGSVTTREYVVNTLLGGVIGGMAGAAVGVVPLTASNLGLLTVGVGTVIGGTWKGVESYRQGNRGWDVVLDIGIGASAGMATAGAVVLSVAMVWGLLQFGSGLLTASIAVKQSAAIGAAGFNLGTYIWSGLQGINAPDPIELPLTSTAYSY